jgi:cytoskeletal protein RodZ
MKVKHLLLGIAIVALMAACGKKEATETPTTTPETEATVEEPAQSAAEATPAVESSKPAAKAEQPKKDEPAKPAVNPCEQATKDYQAFAAKLEAAKQATKTNPGAQTLKDLKALKDQAPAEKAKIDGCLKDDLCGAALKQAVLKVNSVLNAK